MLVALSTVAVMLLYAIPGFLLIKAKLISPSHISSFAKLLMYVCQPFLIVYSMRRIAFSWGMVRDLAVVFALIIFFNLLMMGVGFCLLRRRMRENVRLRIYTLATCMGNYGFMGVPLLEALLPDYPEAIAFSAVACLALSILCWTVASAMITQDKHYMSLKKVLINPTTISFLIAIPLFVTGVPLPTQVEGVITLLGRMCTPLCMLIMGMRLATVSPRVVFGGWRQYLVIAVKQLLLPAVALLIMLPLPLDGGIKASVFIMMACPVASVVLNFAEMLGEGQESAASLVLLGTLLSTFTIPLMMLLL